MSILQVGPIIEMPVSVRVNSVSIGSSTLDHAFLYLAEPTLESVVPSAGIYAGGQNVTVVLRALRSSTVVSIRVNDRLGTLLDQGQDVAWFETPPATRSGPANITVVLDDGTLLTSHTLFSYLQRADWMGFSYCLCDPTDRSILQR
jgi:hypothetical protein